MTTDPLAQLVGRTYSILKDLLPAAENAAVVDFPAHQNFGDSLIYLGQRQYLSKLGYHIAYLGDSHRYSADFLRSRHPEGPIFLHGGGSLGDRYPDAHGFRERVISDFPDRPIIQLPQSMDFTQDDKVQQARKLFAGHRDFLLLLRDQVSLQKARAAFPETRCEFCPDLSFGAGWLTTNAPITRDLTMLMRTDGEQGAQFDYGLEELSTVRVDWSYQRTGQLLWNALAVPRAAVHRFPQIRPGLQRIMESTFDAVATMNVRRGQALLGPGRIVLSNRLHGAVLAALMKKPVVAMDNSYGKIAPIYREYFHELPTVRFAEDAAAARELLLQMHGEQTGAGVHAS